MKKQLEILTVCLNCGNKNDKKNKSSFGVWIGNCDISFKKNIPVASAPHDFGIYSTVVMKLEKMIKFKI